MKAPMTEWVLVPREPTDEMIRAAMHVDLSYMPGHQGPDRAAVYRAMLAAAPSLFPHGGARRKKRTPIGDAK